MHRFVTLSIVAFWLGMTTLLVRNELMPGSSALRQIPLQHVLKLFYMREEPGDLRIFSNSQLLGTLILQPRIDREKGRRLLDFNGTMQVQLPSQARQRFSWDGLLNLDGAFAFKQLNLGLTLHDPHATRAEIETIAGSSAARVTLKQRDEIVSSQEFTFNEAGGRKLLTQLGGDPALFAALNGPEVRAGWQIRARQSSFVIKGERVDTYLVTIEHAGQSLAEIHVDQLGSILHAKTALGYTFAPDDVMP